MTCMSHIDFEWLETTLHFLYNIVNTSVLEWYVIRRTLILKHGDSLLLLAGGKYDKTGEDCSFLR